MCVCVLLFTSYCEHFLTQKVLRENCLTDEFSLQMVRHIELYPSLRNCILARDFGVFLAMTVLLSHFQGKWLFCQEIPKCLVKALPQIV